jgi:hypothetical protein
MLTECAAQVCQLVRRRARSLAGGGLVLCYELDTTQARPMEQYSKFDALAKLQPRYLRLRARNCVRSTRSTVANLEADTRAAQERLLALYHVASIIHWLHPISPHKHAPIRTPSARAPSIAPRTPGPLQLRDNETSRFRNGMTRPCNSTPRVDHAELVKGADTCSCRSLSAAQCVRFTRLLAVRQRL